MLEVIIDREGRFYVNQEEVVDRTVRPSSAPCPGLSMRPQTRRR